MVKYQITFLKWQNRIICIEIKGVQRMKKVIKWTILIFGALFGAVAGNNSRDKKIKLY